jgi:hypothetical protein
MIYNKLTQQQKQSLINRLILLQQKLEISLLSNYRPQYKEEQYIPTGKIIRAEFQSILEEAGCA